MEKTMAQANEPYSATGDERVVPAAGEALRSGTEQAIEEARAALREMADTQKSRIASGLGDMASALHETARTLGSERQDVPARVADMTADQVERMARFVREQSWEDIYDGAEDFARRQPVLFIGSAVAAGFLVARFLKSGTAVAAPPASPYEGTTSGVARTSASFAAPSGYAAVPEESKSLGSEG